MKTRNSYLPLIVLVSMMLCIHKGSAQSINYDAYFELSAGLTFNNSHSVNAQEAFPDGVTFSPDGLKAFVIGLGSKQIHQYSLTVPFDVTSTVTHEGSYDVSIQANFPANVVFKPDGLTMFVVGQTNRTVYEYSLSAAYDITSTVNYTNNSFFFGTRQTHAYAAVFSPDGMTLWIGGGFSEGSLDEFALTAPYDITTASAFATSDGLDGLWDDAMYDFKFSPDGTRLYTLDGPSNDVRELIEFELSVPFDLTSTIAQISTFDPSSEETMATGFTFSTLGDKLFIIGRTGDDINQYDLNKPSFIEGLANDGSISNSRRTFALVDETFNNAGSSLTFGADFSISNLPAGLSAVIAVAADGLSGTLSFSGNATNHQFSDVVSDLIFTFNNSAFAGGDASAVTNATGFNSGISINLRDNAGPFLSYDSYSPIESATEQSTTFSVAGQDANPQALAFSTDGTKLFVVGSAAAVFQYTLTTPFDITSGVSYSGFSHDVSSEETAPIYGLAFNPDGTKMYISGSDDEINQYTLSTGFDLNSTVTHDGSPLDISGQTTNSESITFNGDGSKMYISGFSGTGTIVEYDLNTPYDITTGATFVNSASLSSTATDFVFDPEGTTLYVVFSFFVREYELQAPYALGTGLELKQSINMGSTLRGIRFSSDRSKMFLLSSATDDITQFTLAVDNFEESISNDGSISNTKKIKITDGFFANPGGVLTHGSDFTITGVPSGLTPVLNVATDGLSADLSFTGNASIHTAASSVSDLIFTFNNSAFNGNNASEVINAISASSFYPLSFTDIQGTVFLDNAFDIKGNLTLAAGSFNLRTQSPNPYNPTFSNDGSTFFVVDRDNDQIDQYNLPNPFNFASAALTTSFSVTTEATLPYSVQFNSDGTKMFVLDQATDAIVQYSLSNPFDLSSGVTSDDVSFSVKNLETQPTDFHFNISGQRLYVVGDNERVINQFKLPKAFDLAAQPLFQGSLDVSAEEFQPSAIYLSPDGKRLFVLGPNRDRIYQYDLATPYDITTAEYNFDNLSVSTADTSPSGVSFRPDGYRLFVVGTNFDRMRWYDLDLTNDFSEGVANDGSVVGSFSVGVAGDAFTNAGGTLTHTTDFTISNLPVGLTPIVTISGDGRTATLTFSGNANDHQNANDVSNFDIAFLDGAFVSGDASNVLNSTFFVDLRIDFNNNPTLVYRNGYNLNNGFDFNDKYGIAGNETIPQGITLSDDGMKMYVVGSGHDEVNQYSLTTPFDITSGVSFDGRKAFASGVYTGIQFSNDGSKMYVLRLEQDVIIEMELETPFDALSNTLGSTNVSLGDLDNGFHGFTLSTSGDKLFVSGTTNGVVFQYTVDDPSSLAVGVTYDNVSFDVTPQEPFPSEVQFNPDGTRMFIMGHSSDAIHQYTLTNPYDLSSGVSYDGILLDVSQEEGTPQGFAFGDNGSKIFLTGNTGQDINQYDLTKDSFFESALNNGSVDGIQGIQLYDETFVNAGGTLTEGVHYDVTGLPSGLTPNLAVNNAGNLATLTLNGQATANQNSDDIASLSINFLDDAFTSGSAIGIENNGTQVIAGIDFNDNNPALMYGDLQDLSQLRFIGSSTSFGSEDTGMRGITFNNDGTKMFLVGINTDAVHEYNLSNPYDVTSGVTYTGNSHSILSEETFGASVAFSNDGLTMFVSGFGFDGVHQYSLSSPYVISTGVAHTTSFSVTAQDSGPTSITFNPSGTKMYVIGQTDDDILQYTLDTPFDLTGNVFYDGHPFYIGGHNGVAWGIQFSPDGSKLLISGSSSDRISLFQMNKPFDVTAGGSFVSNFSLRNQDMSNLGMALSPDGSRIFIVGASDGDINQYEFSYDRYNEGARNDGSLTGEQTIFAVDDQFVNPGGQLISGSHFTVNNLPAGLNPILNVDVDGSSAVLTFENNATDHQDVDDVTGLNFTFHNAAFVGGDASIVADATSYVSPFDMDFRDNNPAILYGNILDLAHATLDPNNYDMSAQNNPGGMAINNDGTKIFVCDDGSSNVYQYTLANAYDISSGVTYNGFFDTSSEDGSINEVQFSSDGMKMFTMGSSNNSIYEYALSSPFEITSGVTYAGNSFHYGDYGINVYAFAFNPDGSKMYVSTTSNYELYQFSLGSPYDLTTAVQEGDPLITENVASPTGIAFSPDGRYLIMTEDDNEYSVVRYTLNAPYDLTAGATFDGVHFDLDVPAIWGTGIAIKPDGSRFFIADGDNLLIHQVDIDLGGFTEVMANDGSLTGTLNISIFDDSFINAGGTLSHTTDYTITNLPAGLSPTFSVDSDGYSGILTLSGNATTHGDLQDVAGLEFTFNDSAFPNYPASGVSNAVNANSNIGVDFNPYTENDILTFTFTEINGSSTIDAVNHTVDAEAVAGTNISTITPTITVSLNAAISPDTGTEQDFTTSVNYTVTAEDGTPQVWAITITEALAAPTDISLSDQTIDENASTGTAVGTFSSTDASFNDSHTYTLVAGVGDDDNASFSVVGNELQSTAIFDFETKDTYLVRIQTNDGNSGLFEKAFTISINDVNEVPSDISLDNSSIDESNPIGTVVGTFSTTDEDTGQSYIYSLVPGTGSDDNASFDISGDQLVSNEVFDYETKTSYTVRIQTDDQNGGTFEEAFAITINDLPASVTSVDLSNNTVDENASIGTTVGALSTTGEDLSGSYTYSLVMGTGDTDNSSFDISGMNLITTESFDFEAQNSYSIRVQSDDGNGNIGAFELPIMINDVSEAPTDIMLDITSLVENNAINDVIGSFSTTDVDAGETYSYSLVAGTGDTDNTSFNINGVDLRAGEVFDFETKSSYSIRIQTDDGNGGQFEKSFNITIVDENESILIVNPISDLNLDEGFGSQNLDISGVFTDQDGDALTYSVSSSNTSVVTVSNTGTDVTISEAGGFGTSTITVTADDGSGVTTSDDFIVTVNEVFSTETDITAFSLTEQTGPATIDVVNHTIQIEVDAGTNVTSLTPTIDVSPGASYSPQGAQNFTSSVTYTVTAEDGITTQNWSITVTVAEPALGLADAAEIDIYPNPVVNVLNIRSSNELSVQLIDLKGNTLRKAEGSNLSMNVSQLPAGMYLLILDDGDTKSQRRILKNN